MLILRLYNSWGWYYFQKLFEKTDIMRLISYLCLPSLKFCFLPDGEADDIKEEFADDYLAKLLKKHVKQKR